MKRRFSTRDPGLTLRMALALLLVVAFYAAIAAAVVALVVAKPSWAVFVIAIGAIVVVTAVTHMAGTSRLLLSRSGARELQPHEHRDLRDLVARLSALAEIPEPEVRTISTKSRNAFAVGVHRDRAVVVVTTGLLHALEPDELEAVVAHELSHIANRDAAVLTFVTAPRVLGETLIGAFDNNSLVFFAWFFIWWAGIPLWALGSVLTLTISRYREFAADRGSAMLTGRPETLMSALVKLEDEEGIPKRDLRSLGSVEAFCIVPSGGARFGLLRDHPPLEQRLARLGEMSRELGKPVGP